MNENESCCGEGGCCSGSPTEPSEQQLSLPLAYVEKVVEEYTDTVIDRKDATVFATAATASGAGIAPGGE